MTASSPLLLGIDLGTSAVKAVLINTDGAAVKAGMEYASLSPQEGWMEQSPQTWVETTVRVVRTLLKQLPDGPAQVSGIGLSGQMHGAVILDEAGKPLRNAIIWADQRSQPQVKYLYERLGRDKILRLTGNPLFPGFMLPTLLWLRENEPQNWRKCRHAMLPKDYLRYVLTGEIFSEPSDASATGLFDLENRFWSSEMAALADLDLRLLPRILASTAVAGSLKAGIATEMGLQAGIPVVCGGSDQACQAAGSGLITPGKVSCTIGSGGQIFAPVDRPDPDPLQRYHLFCHVVPDLWHLEAATLTAGLSLRWLRDILGGSSYQELAQMAAAVSVGAEGLLFAPYLLGERTPHMDPGIRGGFAGLSMRHQRGHLARAVMEGVVYSLRSGLELMRESGVEFARVIAAGGAVQHELWLQLQADIFNLPVIRSANTEPAAAGAALLAGVGTGLFPDIQTAVGKTVRYEDPVFPQPKAVTVYNQLFPVFLKLYPSLKPFSRSALA